MKKVALIFVLAVLLPSLVLAWLAVRSLRDQQFLIERQQSLLCQRVTDALAQNVNDQLVQWQQDFAAQVESIVGHHNPRSVGVDFDNLIRQRWPLADVGFCVTLSGKIIAPSPNARTEAQSFYLDNRAFLGNRESAEVYWNTAAPKNVSQNLAQSRQSSWAGAGMLSSSADGSPSHSRLLQEEDQAGNDFGSTAGSGAATKTRKAPGMDILFAQPSAKTAVPAGVPPSIAKPQDLTSLPESAEPAAAPPQSSLNYKQAQVRKVCPQSQLYQAPMAGRDKVQQVIAQAQNNLSKAIPAEAEFSQLVGTDNDGMLARFLQNRLKLMFWHRLNRAPDLIFGAELNLHQVENGLRGMIHAGRDLEDEICLALLDDNAKPVVLSQPNFKATWKRPFVATEIGDALPHWEVAAYLVNPAQLTQAARTASLTLGLLIAVLVLAIGVGSWLVVSSMNAELRLARQKTDFVSNVSHELKTPLTSIRMFSELLAEGRITDHGKQRSYLNIITAEAARLTRLINNVLDFSRIERGEKKYNFQRCDLSTVLRTTAETFRPHLEANGFKFDYELPGTPIPVQGDPDALSQVVVNLLSNAEKYSNHSKEIALRLVQKQSPLPHAEIQVLDRGTGVPRGSAEKIFEKFYRAHDALSNGIQGSGLGLTIARQIARAHGGEVTCEARDGGGSRFILRLPLKSN